MSDTQDGSTGEQGEDEWAWAGRWLSDARLAAYLAACGGDTGTALALHEWNLRLAGIVMADTLRLEIALRNAYARVLQDALGDGWLLDDSSPLRAPIMRMSGAGVKRDVNLITRRAIDTAARGAAAGDDPTGHAVAGLTLGFWTHLTDRSRERDLWIPILHRAWPEGTSRARLNARLEAVNRLRNRAAHAERLFNPTDPRLSPLRVDADLFALLGQLCPQAQEYAYPDGRAGVESFLQQDPSPAPVTL